MFLLQIFTGGKGTKIIEPLCIRHFHVYYLFYHHTLLRRSVLYPCFTDEQIKIQRHEVMGGMVGVSP